MHKRKSKALLVTAFALAMGVTGCASAGGGGGSGGGGPNRITLAELEGLEQFDAYATIQRLRPRWLQSRGGGDPVVHVDGARRMGGLGELRGIRAADIQQMEYLSANDASTRFGTGYQGGAILVTTKR